MNRSLKAYLSLLEQRGELITITRYVNPNQELADLADRQAALPGGGKALLFTNTGANFPIAANLFSSAKRILYAFGAKSMDHVVARGEAFFQTQWHSPQNRGHHLFHRNELGEWAQYHPRHTESGPCQEVALFPPNLNRIPFFKYRAFDQAYSINGAQLVLQDPQTQAHCITSVRLMWHSENTLQLCIEPSGPAAHILSRHTEGRIPVALYLGGDPLYMLSHFLSMPAQVELYHLVGFLRKKSVVTVPCLSQPLEVPEDCDVVMEGYIDLNEAPVPSVPCAGENGFYTRPGVEPLMHLSCITHRKDAVMPASVPPLSYHRTDKHFGTSLSNLFISKEITRIHFTPFSTKENLIVASIDKHYDGQPYKVAHSIWGAHHTAHNKVLIVVDHHVDPSNWREVNQAINRYYNPSTHTLFSRGPVGYTEHAAPKTGFGGKICIDATCKRAQVPAPGKVDNRRCFALCHPQDPMGPKTKIRITVDDALPLERTALCLWYALSQTDPIRDAQVINGTLCINACIKDHTVKGAKMPWPNVACASKETIDAVDQLWDLLKIGPWVPSPSLALQPLLRPGHALINEQKSDPNSPNTER